MSLGKMNATIAVTRRSRTVDSEGFPGYSEQTLLKCRAYMEERNMSERWKNSTVFADATVLFRFRFVPGIAITTQNYITHKEITYNIISIENVRQRCMYYEVFAKRAEVSNG